MLKTPSHDHTTIVTTISEENDGCSTVAWHMHRHTSNSLDDDDNMVDRIHLVWSMFNRRNGALKDATQKVRDLMAKCHDVNLKISYSRTITKMVVEILQRNTRYLTPMEKWIRCLDPKYKNDAWSLFT